MYNIDDIRRQLLIKYPPFGSYLANLPFIEDRQCLYKGKPTLSTDDTAVYYHPDFIEKINEKQRIAVFAHEISHVVLEHIKRGEGKDFDTWNIATDASINENLKKDGLELVEGMIERSDALLYSEEELYEKILKEKQENPNQENKEPHVSHESWKKAAKNKDQELKENSNSEGSKCSMMSANELFQKARKEKLENLKKLKKSLIEQSTSINPNQSIRSRSVGSLGDKTNLVNWRKLLVDSCHMDSDWTYQNATIEYGVLTPQREELPMPLVEILLDTSGSIQDKLLRNFLRECMGILCQSKIKVGCFDDRFYGFHEIRTKKDIENFPLKGGGGTDFDVAVESFTKDADNKIIFTDGYASMPKKYVSAIWVVFGSNRIQPKGGKVIQISEEEIQKLHFISKEDYTSSKRQK